MTRRGERRGLMAGALTVIFTSALAIGLLGFRHAHDESGNVTTWIHWTRTLSSSLMVLCALWGYYLLFRGHHHRHSATDLTIEERRSVGLSMRISVPSADDAQRHREEQLVRGILSTFPLASCMLLLGLSSTVWVMSRTTEPLFLRVVTGTLALMCGLWLAGLLSTRRRAGRLARRL